MKRQRIARKSHKLRTKAKLFIGVNECFQQPAPEKTGPASDEQPLTAQFFPKITGVIEDVSEIGLRYGRHKKRNLRAET